MPKPKKLGNNVPVQPATVVNDSQNINPNEASGTGSLDNHEIVQPEGVNISQYRRLNISVVPQEELNERIAEANAINNNKSFIYEEYEKACAEHENELKQAKNGPEENLEEVELKVFDTFFGNVVEKVHSINIITYKDFLTGEWRVCEGEVADQCPAIQEQIQDYTESFSSFLNEDDLKKNFETATNTLLEKGVLKEVGSKEMSGLDPNGNVIPVKSSIICPANWFDASIFPTTALFDCAVVTIAKNLYRAHEIAEKKRLVQEKTSSSRIHKATSNDYSNSLRKYRSYLFRRV